MITRNSFPKILISLSANAQERIARSNRVTMADSVTSPALDKPEVCSSVRDGVGHISFFHPKSNSLPGEVLSQLAGVITELGENSDARVVYLTSGGEGAFCAGASFDELKAIKSSAEGEQFFMGFARVILAMRRIPKFIVTRVHGKIVGGGVGVVAASDYALAMNTAAVRLSELAIGIGPFVVGPAVERRIGSGPFSALAIDSGWRDALWARTHGLYAEVYDDVQLLDRGISQILSALSCSSVEAMADLKRILWSGTEHWEELLPKRAGISGSLLLTEQAQKAINSIKRS